MNRIIDELDGDRKNKMLASEYRDLASDILAWTEKWTSWLQNRPDDHCLNDAQTRLNEFRRYRLQEKVGYF